MRGEVRVMANCITGLAGASLPSLPLVIRLAIVLTWFLGIDMVGTYKLCASGAFHANLDKKNNFSTYSLSQHIAPLYHFRTDARKRREDCIIAMLFLHI